MIFKLILSSKLLDGAVGLSFFLFEWEYYIAKVQQFSNLYDRQSLRYTSVKFEINL